MTEVHFLSPLLVLKKISVPLSCSCGSLAMTDLHERLRPPILGWSYTASPCAHSHALGSTTRREERAVPGKLCESLILLQPFSKAFSSVICWRSQKKNFSAIGSSFVQSKTVRFHLCMGGFMKNKTNKHNNKIGCFFFQKLCQIPASSPAPHFFPS